jgi:hypothetical protein
MICSAAWEVLSQGLIPVFCVPIGCVWVPIFFHYSGLLLPAVGALSGFLSGSVWLAAVMALGYGPIMFVIGLLHELGHA